MSETIRVILADDHTLVRRSVARVLLDCPGISVMAEVGNADDAITAALQFNPNVVVLDIDMPGISSFDAARTIISRCPAARILFLSAFTHDRNIEAALAAGALGYLYKNESPEKVIEAIRAVARDECFFSPEVQSRLVIDSDGVHLGHASVGRAASLTNREMEVFRYIARGLSKKEIAKTMHLSVKTVENHAASIMDRLNIHDRVELTRFAIREGLIEA